MLQKLIIDWCSCQFSSRVFGVIVVTFSADVAGLWRCHHPNPGSTCQTLRVVDRHWLAPSCVRVIVDHHMSIYQTGRPVACAQYASRTEAHCSASLRAWRFSAAHCSASLRAVRFANGLRKYHRRERHDGTTHSHVDFLNLKNI